jgi:hypothetical protein
MADTLLLTEGQTRCLHHFLKHNHHYWKYERRALAWIIQDDRRLEEQDQG